MRQTFGRSLRRYGTTYVIKLDRNGNVIVAQISR